MKSFMEEYGKIVVAAIVVMIFAVVASPIGTALKDGVRTTVDKITESMKPDGNDSGEGSVEGTETDSVLVYKAAEGNYTVGGYYNKDGTITSTSVRGYTNKIEVQEGSKYYFSLSDLAPTSSQPVICTFDSNGDILMGYKLSEISTLEESGLISEYEFEYAYITIPEGVKYIVVNAIYSYPLSWSKFDLEEVYVYKNSLPKEALHTYKSNLTGTNHLTGKSMIVFGDSIAYGQMSKRESFVTYIAEGNNMSFVNKGASGAKTTAILNSFTSTNTSSYDYIIVEGFVNDIAATETTLGTLTTKGTTEFDTTTFIGSLENAIYQYKESGNTAKLGFVLTKELPRKTEVQRQYWDAAISVFEKYDVAYLDLFNDDYTLLPDNVHPHFAGQLEMAEVIEAWMNTL